MSAGYLRRCAGKRKHPDQEAAERHRRQLVACGKARLDQMNTYRCDQCLGWHVGHPGRRPRGGKGRKR